MLWFKSYLSNKSQYVTVNGVKSHKLCSSVGIPQGSTLGPLLFSLYVNELPDICPDLNVQLYADDAVVFAHGSSADDIASKLTEGLNRIQTWLENQGLVLNTAKTVCMYLSKTSVELPRSNVYIGSDELELVSHFKYLGVILDSQLSFKKHIKKVTNVVKFNLQNFRQIRPYMSNDAAKTYLHCMILSHMEYCFPIWSVTDITTLKPIEQLYKQSIKILDKESNWVHHCPLLKKYSLLNFKNLKTFKYGCLIYKTIKNMAPPPLKQFFKQKDIATSRIITRSITRGDCEIQHRNSVKTRNVLSVVACKLWNTLPVKIRKCSTLSTFKKCLKKWLLVNQTCDHI